MLNPAEATLLYRHLEKVLDYNNEKLSEEEVIRHQTNALSQLLVRIINHLTEKEKIVFHSFHARMAYAAHSHQFPKQLLFHLNYFRKMWQEPQKHPPKDCLSLGVAALSRLVTTLYKSPIPKELLSLFPDYDAIIPRVVQVADFKAAVKAVLLFHNKEEQYFEAQSTEIPFSELRIKYNVTGINTAFNDTIKIILQFTSLPVTVNLLDVEIDEQGVLYPRAIVLEPDYLIDVSAISGCFEYWGSSAFFSLLKKMQAYENSAPLMLGNIANFFLDELLTDSTQSFKELFKKTFGEFPIPYALFTDPELKDIYLKSQMHYSSLKYMVNQGFKEMDIDQEKCYLEPSFYSPKYGLQGRLDMWFPNGAKSAIVELKSGGQFMPNKFGLNHAHFIQTTQYEMIVEAVFGKKIKALSYILYSKLRQDRLKYAYSTKVTQHEALQLRNQIIGLEYWLINAFKNGVVQYYPLSKLTPSSIPKAKGFNKNYLEKFENTYKSISILEKKYWTAFVSFIAREQHLAKLGIFDRAGQSGFSSLWLKSYQEKNREFEVLGSLTLIENKAIQSLPTLRFRRSEATNKLANFRQGDIAVLYPAQDENSQAIDDQIFKVSIIDIDDNEILVKLRYKQFYNNIFDEKKNWHLEHDMLEASFNALYRSLYAFYQYTPPTRNKILGLTPPALPEITHKYTLEGMTTEQVEIFNKMWHAEDYFLLWGPPGTGKTSVMLKHFARELYESTSERIMLLAYTNRAVDEICAALMSCSEEIQNDFIRIGSRVSTSEAYHFALLNEKIKLADSRRLIKSIIRGHRIIVATVASAMNKPELFSLCDFDTVIIDEASQILEPNLLGLLPKFKRFILIGDHRQLPAVVVQEKQFTKVTDENLLEIGLHDLRNSYFERMYFRCIAQGWDWAYAQLKHQGRMHQEVMDFSSHFFYENKLKILPSTTSRGKAQTLPLPNIESEDILENTLAQNRVLFIDTEAVPFSPTPKTNPHEAQTIVALIKILKKQGKLSTPSALGVITPYRAQIAQIRAKLFEANLGDLANITIDTVERYQGGARDIILISLCVNNENQLATLVSEGTENHVDRKLNVALTRAREQIILLGNAQILKQNAIYREFVERYEVEVPDFN